MSVLALNYFPLHDRPTPLCTSGWVHSRKIVKISLFILTVDTSLGQKNTNIFWNCAHYPSLCLRQGNYRLFTTQLFKVKWPEEENFKLF